MSIGDAFAYAFAAATLWLLIAVPYAALKGQGRLWFFKLVALAVALAGLAALQYPGKGAFFFNIFAIGIWLSICLLSAVFAIVGRHIRNSRTEFYGS